jgi:hypothetical protein
MLRFFGKRHGRTMALRYKEGINTYPPKFHGCMLGCFLFDDL